MSIEQAKLIQSLRRADSSKIKKGEFNGVCNRGACNNKNAIWYNSPMYKFYCTRCARMINENSNQSGMGDICELKTKEI